jgi:hypothetical protein
MKYLNKTNKITTNGQNLSVNDIINCLESSLKRYPTIDELCEELVKRNFNNICSSDFPLGFIPGCCHNIICEEDEVVDKYSCECVKSHTLIESADLDDVETLCYDQKSIIINGYAFYKNDNTKEFISRIGDLSPLCYGGHKCDNALFLPKIIVGNETIKANNNINFNNLNQENTTIKNFFTFVFDSDKIQNNTIQFKLDCLLSECHENISWIVLTYYSPIDKKTKILFNNCIKDDITYDINLLCKNYICVTPTPTPTSTPTASVTATPTPTPTPTSSPLPKEPLSITDLYNTGVDDNKQALGYSSTDSHWTVVNSPNDTYNGLAKAIWTPSWIGENGTPNTNNATWITVPQAVTSEIFNDLVNAPTGLYTFETKFTLPNNFISVNISGYWSADNFGGTLIDFNNNTPLIDDINFYIILNDSPVNINPNFFYGLDKKSFVINDQNLFVPGENVLQFNVSNTIGDSSPNPIGTQIVFTSATYEIIDQEPPQDDCIDDCEIGTILNDEDCDCVSEPNPCDSCTPQEICVNNVCISERPETVDCNELDESFEGYTINGYAYYFHNSNAVAEIPNTSVILTAPCSGGHICNRTIFKPKLIIDEVVIEADRIINLNNLGCSGENCDRYDTFNFNIADPKVLEKPIDFRLDCDINNCHSGITWIVLTFTNPLNNVTSIIFNSCVVPNSTKKVSIECQRPVYIYSPTESNNDWYDRSKWSILNNPPFNPGFSDSRNLTTEDSLPGENDEVIILTKSSVGIATINISATDATPRIHRLDVGVWIPESSGGVEINGSIEVMSLATFGSSTSSQVFGDVGSSGNITLVENSIWKKAIIFYGSSINKGVINGNVVLKDESTNEGTINGSITCLSTGCGD